MTTLWKNLPEAHRVARGLFTWRELVTVFIAVTIGGVLALGVSHWIGWL